MYLSRDDIAKASDIKSEDVPVPEWGGTVLVRGLSGAERDNYIASLSRQVGTKVHRNPANATAKLVALCVVDDDGKRLFPEPQDVALLGRKSGAALDRVFEVAARLSGLSGEDIEDLEGNSPATQNDGSISG
jgi:hypothetical protein